MSYFPIPEHEYDPNCEYLTMKRGCYWCCDACNYDQHRCPMCGEDLNHNGEDNNGPHPCLQNLPN